MSIEKQEIDVRALLGKLVKTLGVSIHDGNKDEWNEAMTHACKVLNNAMIKVSELQRLKGQLTEIQAEINQIEDSF